MLLLEILAAIVELLLFIIIAVAEAVVGVLGFVCELLAVACMIILAPIVWLVEYLSRRLIFWPPSLRTLMRFINAVQVVLGIVGLPPAAYLCYTAGTFPGAQAAGIAMGVTSTLLIGYAIYVFYNHFTEESKGSKRL